MNIKHIFHLTWVSFIVFSSSYSLVKKQFKEFTAPIALVNIDVDISGITISPTQNAQEKPSVTMAVKCSSDECQFPTIELTNGELTIKRIDGTKDPINLNIKVPAKTDIEIRNQDSNINIHNIKGLVDLSLKRGTIKAESLKELYIQGHSLIIEASEIQKTTGISCENSSFKLTYKKSGTKTSVIIIKGDQLKSTISLPSSANVYIDPKTIREKKIYNPFSYSFDKPIDFNISHTATNSTLLLKETAKESPSVYNPLETLKSMTSQLIGLVSQAKKISDLD